MRYIILIFIFTISSLCSFAQRVNEHGLKMVSEIIYNDAKRGNTYRIEFGYSDKDRLSAMTVFVDWGTKGNYELYKKAQLTDNGLTYKDYYLFKDGRYECSFDLNGYLTSVSYYHTYDDGSIERYDYRYYYHYDKGVKMYVLEKYEWVELYKKKHHVSWYQQSNVISNNVDDLRDRYDYTHANDININILPLFGYEIMGGDMRFEFLSITEWLNVRRDYFVKPFTDTRKYEYQYDENHNLIEVLSFRHLKNWKLTDCVKIKYLY